jgi:hypothetical protein
VQKPTLQEVLAVVHRKSDAAKVLSLHPEAGRRGLRHVALVAGRGVKFGFAQAFRTKAGQAAIWAIGRNETGAVVDRRKVVTWAAPGWSFHEYALAYDAVLLRPKPNAKGFYEVEWSSLADMDADGIRDYLEIGLAGEEVGMEWGGRWRRGKTDEPHFEFTPDLPIEVAVSRFPNRVVPDDYFEKAS